MGAIFTFQGETLGTVFLSSEVVKKIASMDTRWDRDAIKAYDTYLYKKAQVKRTGRTAYKDSTQSKVYSAEHAFVAKVIPRKFKDLNDAQSYLRKVLNSKTWSKLAGDKTATLMLKKNMGERSRYSGWATYDGEIYLCPTKGLDEYTLLHELAHIAGHMHHDVPFRACLLALVARFMGRTSADMLKAEFRARKLKLSVQAGYKEPHVWLESYLRLQKAREIKDLEKVV